MIVRLGGTANTIRVRVSTAFGTWPVSGYNCYSAHRQVLLHTHFVPLGSPHVDKEQK